MRISFWNHRSTNDIYILHSSLIVESSADGVISPLFRISANSVLRKTCYHLIDVMYPKWALFIDRISDAASRIDNLCSGAQELVRKDMRRIFGVVL